MSHRVVKVGGSLLDLPDLADRIRSRLSDRPGANVLIPGGGALADCIRQYDATFRFDPSFIHQVAIETMRITAMMLAKLLDVPLVQRMDDKDVEHRKGTFVLDVESLLAEEPLCLGEKLKSNWSVTSDSISARIAQITGAEELWLMKSVTPLSDDLSQLVRDGVVDPAFPLHARGLAWRIIDLRDAAVQPDRQKTK